MCRLTIGDPESIRKRDEGRAAFLIEETALLQMDLCDKVECPSCIYVDPKCTGPVISLLDIDAGIVKWECCWDKCPTCEHSHGTVEFKTDLSGGVIK